MSGIVAMVVLLVGSGWLWREWERSLRRRARLEIEGRNYNVQVVYREAGMRWYPHKLANGDVRWYDVSHDPMDV